jgi:hypothetical protein
MKTNWNHTFSIIDETVNKSWKKIQTRIDMDLWHDIHDEIHQTIDGQVNFLFLNTRREVVYEKYN